MRDKLILPLIKEEVWPAEFAVISVASGKQRQGLFSEERLHSSGFHLAGNMLKLVEFPLEKTRNLCEMMQCFATLLKVIKTAVEALLKAKAAGSSIPNHSTMTYYVESTQAG